MKTTKEWVVIISTTIKAKDADEARQRAEKALVCLDNSLAYCATNNCADVDDVLEAKY